MKKPLGLWSCALIVLSVAACGEGKPERSADELVNLSLEYFQANDYAASIAAAEEALEIEPDNQYAYNNICAANNRLGEWDRAIAACREALEIAPDFARARNNLHWAQSKKAGAGQ